MKTAAKRDVLFRIRGRMQPGQLDRRFVSPQRPELQKENALPPKLR